ncbi:hypothetical protein [Aliarcobacter butzleri]|uniref:hypothetical protein n=1 Tax=Aliarcobacter butzleri TaxID=28197 RepID=UPI00125FB350|nr:hypothetical protein [Aliarcobacter butzleri]MCG3683415.1 hypothetical protein [Aliarcobacter butzleri]MCT7586426.1 hypothetical protein [Aliarcobacter butzleri]
MSKIVQIGILDFNVDEALKKGLDIKDEIMMSSMPKSYNFLIQTDDKCIYMAELKNTLHIKRMSKKLLYEIKKNFEKEKQNIIDLEFEYNECNECIGYKLKNKLIELLIKN